MNQSTKNLINKMLSEQAGLYETGISNANNEINRIPNPVTEREKDFIARAKSDKKHREKKLSELKETHTDFNK